MHPSPRTGRFHLRTWSACALVLIVSHANAADELCKAPPVDPRLEELRNADATDPRIEVTSDSGDLGREGDARLKGNVRIRTGQRLLTADEASINATDRSIELKGDVEYLDPQLNVRGSGGNFDGRGQGQFSGAQFALLDRSVRGSARHAAVRENGRIELEGVVYTACPVGQDDWQLRAGEIAINQQSQIGTGRDVKLEFLGVPIVYVPWISFPVGDRRKTGLLFPEIGSSGDSGTQLVIPRYWNIAPNRDATITTRYFSERGLRLDPEFRYLTESSRGILDAQYLFDDLKQGDSRGFVEWRHVTRLQPRTRLLVDAADVSDNDYFEDFGVGFEGTSVTFLERMGELRHDTDHWRLRARAQDWLVIDQLLPDEDEPYTLLPQLAALGRWDDLPAGFEASMRGEISNFTRDLGPEGIRVDAEPSLGWRAERHGAYVEADAAWRYTGYSLDHVEDGAEDAPSRDAPILSVDSGLVLERAAGSRGQRLQTLEPRIKYLYVPFRNQDDLPVFDTGLPDLSLVQLFRTNRYVGADRLSDANQLSAGITTRLLDAAGGRQFLSATLGQAYYFDNPKVRLPDEPVDSRSSSDVIAELELTAFQHWSARMGYQWDPENSRTEKSEIYLQYAPATDRVINAGYRFRRDFIEQFDVSTAWPINERWRGFARWVYSTREEKTLDRFVGLEYRSCCWAVRLVSRRFVNSRSGDSDSSIGLQLELKGLSSVGVDNEAFLRDAIRGYSAQPGPAVSK
jgi:LPS-assembly protein